MKKRFIAKDIDTRILVFKAVPLKNFSVVAFILTMGMFVGVGQGNFKQLIVILCIAGITAVLLSEINKNETVLNRLKRLIQYSLSGDYIFEKGWQNDKPIIRKKSENKR